MVSKKHRFKGQNSIRYIFRKGDTIRGSIITVRYVTNFKKDSYRVAVVVSKKVTKLSPVRNRIRRRIYESIRLNSPKYLTNQDAVFLVFSDKLATIPAAELDEMVVNMLQQIQRNAKP